MKNQNPQNTFSPVRAFKKLFLSAFVLFSFIAYALNKPASASQSNLGDPAATNQAVPPAAPVAQNNQAQSASANNASTAPQQGFVPAPTQPAATDTTPPTAAPTAQPQLASNAGQYKDGTYNGPQIDAFYGIVQVQVKIQNGKISNVQFLQYPNDRRTSVRINSIAMPYLQQEAVQAQSANVNLITGATLTSEGFQMSLQAALSQAKG